MPRVLTAGRQETLRRYNNSEKGKIAQRKYRRTEAGKALSRRAKLKYYYSLSYSEYGRLFDRQGGNCAICKRNQTELRRRLDIDHDHTTGKVRGLLCSRCNRHLGRFERGREYNTEFTAQMLEYLQGVHENASIGNFRSP